MTETNRYVATLLDCTGIQDYIFGSNRLRENIGASELVARATRECIQEALHRAVGEDHNLDDLLQEQPLEKNPDQKAEVIFQGGGNVVLLFRSIADARATVCELSHTLLEQAPGLEVAAVHSAPFDWNAEKLADAGDDERGIMTGLAEEMAQYKQQRARSAPLAGLGVTLACRATGWPATCIFTDPEETPLPVSAEVAAKIAWRGEASKRLNRELLTETTLCQDYAIPERFDHMGRSRGEVSYLAVVHADGNSMGKRFQDAGKGKDNRAYINAVRKLSEAVNTAGKQALRKTVGAMEAMLRQQTEAPQATPQSESQAYLDEVVRLVSDLGKAPNNHPNRGMPFLPFRPLVYGGDDVTFVCDGRLGLALAICYLRAFEEETRDLPGGRACACAGVAIVKTHYPFVHAYQQAEALCKNAKQFVRERKKEGKGDASAIDWHFAASGRSSSISDIRKREYRSTDDKCLLNLRPLLLCAGEDDKLRTWSVFEQAAWQLKYHNDWRERRNKVKALRETLRQGKDDVKQFLTRYDGLERLPRLDRNQSPDSQEGGFQDDRCLYFDAIEALDVFLPLEPVTPLDKANAKE
jgi:hypothetical protein